MPFRQRSATRPFPRLRKGLRLAWHMGRHLDVAIAAMVLGGKMPDFKHPFLGLSTAFRPFQPLCCAGWDEREKLARMVDHLKTVERLGGILLPLTNAPRLLATLSDLGDDYSVKIDEPFWMLNDGLAALSVWKGIDRIFTLSFLLTSSSGQLGCFVGGLQGRREDGVLDIYRAMTKEAHGLRPRDLIIELHRMFCRSLGVTHITAVADQARYQYDRYFGAEPLNVSSLSYDEAWAERGGSRINSSWFRLPINPVRRTIDEIPAKKRSLYARRYRLLDSLEQAMARAVNCAFRDDGLTTSPSRHHTDAQAPLREGDAPYRLV